MQGQSRTRGPGHRRGAARGRGGAGPAVQEVSERRSLLRFPRSPPTRPLPLGLRLLLGVSSRGAAGSRALLGTFWELQARSSCRRARGRRRPSPPEVAAAARALGWDRRARSPGARGPSAPASGRPRPPAVPAIRTWPGKLPLGVTGAHRAGAEEPSPRAPGLAPLA